MFILQWKVGPGLMGEQGGESIHHVFADLEERHCCAANNNVEKLSRVMKEHHCSVYATPSRPSAELHRSRQHAAYLS